MVVNKSIQEINRAISEKTASVRTEVELWEELRAGADPETLDVDVVVVSFSAPISGSAAMMLVPVAGRGVFTRARKIWLNGVEGHPGPAPNERLGVVDTQILADAGGAGNGEGVPPGARLMMDLLEGREIRVQCLSEEGGTYYSSFKMGDIEFARMITYNTPLPASRVNEGSNEHLETIRIGSKVLLNRATGIVLGCGTRGLEGFDSLSVSADMFDMDPRCVVSGDHVTVSLAFAVPVMGPGVLRDVCTYLKSLTESHLHEAVTPVDVEIALHLKNAICDGGFLFNDSSFQITRRPAVKPEVACSCSGGAVERR